MVLPWIDDYHSCITEHLDQELLIIFITSKNWLELVLELN